MTLRLLEEVPPILDTVTLVLVEHGYPARDVNAVRLVLEEAVTNGIRHGNGGDPALSVAVRFHVTAERVLAEVEDQGAGFDPAQVPDPCASENLPRPGGRGLFLMHHYATWVHFNGRGNCVSFGKVRSGSDTEALSDQAG
jgi:serine/threonine-protein kinase RsbW